MKTSFFNIGNEEFDGTGEVVEAITPEEAIEEQQESAEVTDVAAEIDGHIEEMAAGDETVADLEEQVAVNEEKLATPEEVTTADVVVAQEALRYSAKRLGLNPDDVFGQRVSHESIDKSPLTALQVSNEDMKGFISKVSEQAKAIWAKIIASMKRLYVKALVFVSRTEKKALALKETIKAAGEMPSDAKFDEGQVKRIQNILGTVGATSGAVNASGLSAMIKGYNDKYATTYVASATLAMSEISDMSKEDAKALTNKQIEIAKKVKDEYHVTDNGLAGIQKGDLYVPIITDGNKVYGMNIPVVVDAGEGKGVKGRIEPKTAKQLPVIKDAVKVEFPSKTELLTLTSEIAKVAGGTKSMSDKTLAALDKAKEYTDKIYKDAMNSVTDNAVKANIVNYTASVRTLTSYIALSTIKARLGGLNNSLAYCAAAAKYLKAGK